MKRLSLFSERFGAIVVGGGTAGSICGIALARLGVKTLIVERGGCLGGTSTSGMVSPAMASYVNAYRYSGVFHRVEQRLNEAGFAVPDWDATANECGWFHNQALSQALEAAALEGGAQILYHTRLVSAAVKGGRVTHLVLQWGQNVFPAEADFYCDCTGDAALSREAGVSCAFGDGAGGNQAATLRFEMGGVDLAAFSEYLASYGQTHTLNYPCFHTATDCSEILAEEVRRGVERGELEPGDAAHFQMMSMPGKRNSLSFNCPELGQYRSDDPLSASHLLAEGRRGAFRIAAFMRRHFPGFGGSFVAAISEDLGLRATYRIRPVYRLTIEDVLHYSKFPDGVAKSNYPVDVHGEIGKDLRYAAAEPGERYFEIPLRSMLPAGYENLIVAGRCIGTDYLAQATCRVQHCCRAEGEAAACAVYGAIEEGISLPRVSGARVRELMRAFGTEIGMHDGGAL